MEVARLGDLGTGRGICANNVRKSMLARRI